MLHVELAFCAGVVARGDHERAIKTMDKVDPVAKYLLIQVGIAIAFPVVWMSAVLTLDIGGIARLVAMCEQPLMTAAVLFAGSIAVLAPMIFATGVMLLADR